MHFLRIIAISLAVFFPFSLPAQDHPASDFFLSQLRQDLGKRGFSPEITASLAVKDFYQSAQTGLYYLFLHQQWQGIPLEGVQFQAVMDHRGEVRRLLPGAYETDAPGRAPIPSDATAEAAILSVMAAFDLGGEAPLLTAEPVGASRAASWSLPLTASQPVKTRLNWVLTKATGLQLAWMVDLPERSGAHWRQCWVDPNSGDLLIARDLVVHCEFAHPGHECADHSHHPFELKEAFSPNKTYSAGTYRVFDMPVESPSHGGRTLVTDPHDLVASPFGWHDTNGVPGPEFTITRGNNVFASEDRLANNQPGESPDGGASLNFDFPIDFTQPPFAYLDAATTNLFYWNNLMHDVWYHYGFDEVSGNFQQNNYGRGGLGNDFVRADAQDGSGTNNANFATPADGSSPRMQMFIWNPPGASVRGLTVNSPSDIAGTYATTFANFGPSLTTLSITGDVEIVNAATGTPIQGCGPLLNGPSMQGKIALVDRGACTFVEKVKNAQDAGAIGVIVVNNTAGNLIALGGTDPSITIPSVMISQANGNVLKNQINAGAVVNVTLSNTGSPDSKDSGLDNGVIAHEYGHGISTRLTGGPSTSCLFNQEQAGEGWSDWFGLVMTVKPGDVGAAPRGVATYLQGQSVTGSGIRPARYSTDLSVNPLTYNNIKTLSIPHGVGTVWASMIWDLYWNLVEVYGWDPDIYRGSGGNNIAMQLVMEGLKLQNCFPGFVDSRDAILAADSLLYNGVNTCLIWKTFARRGLGYSARQNDPNDRSDGVEAFDLPPVCQEILFVEKRSLSERAPAGQNAVFEFIARNQKDTPLAQVIVRDTLAQGLTLAAGTATCPVTDNNGILEFDLGALAPGATVSCRFEAVVSPAFPPSVFQWDDDLEQGAASRYVIQADQGALVWRLDSGNARSLNTAWFAPNRNGVNDQSIVFTLPTLAPQSILRFWHRFETEPSFDGGVVEILPATTGIWTDLGPYMLENGYVSLLDAGNPLGARPGFTGRSKGYILTRVDLSSFAGQAALFRFRFASDEFLGVDGWYIDDISVLTERSFTNSLTAVSSDGDEINAKIPLEILVTEGTTSFAMQNLASFYRLYPNPAVDRAVLDWDLGAPSPETLTLLNLMGSQVRRFQPGGTHQAELDLSGLPSGMYLLEAVTAKGKAVWKLRVDPH